MRRFKIENLLDLNRTIASGLFKNYIYPWEVLGNISDFINYIGPSLPKSDFEEVYEKVWISKYAKINSNSSINGPSIIDSEADIRFGAFIRGSVIVGKKSVIGNSTELKNCVLFDEVQAPHFNYVGDSVMGFRSHIGAGVVLSNVKSDKSDVVVRFQGQNLQTNLRKFGAVLGDYVEVGCNSVLNPGTLVGKRSTIYPLTMVRGCIEEGKILKNNGIIVDKI